LLAGHSRRSSGTRSFPQYPFPAQAHSRRGSRNWQARPTDQHGRSSRPAAAPGPSRARMGSHHFPRTNLQESGPAAERVANRNEAAQFPQPECADGLLNFLENDGIRKQERKIPLHRRISWQSFIPRRAQWMFVQAIEIDFAEVNVLPQLAFRCYLRMNLPELR